MAVRLDRWQSEMVYELLTLVSGLLEKLDSLANIAMGIGIVLFTILIPLAIAALQNVYRTRGEADTPFAELDLNVVLDRVFRIRRLLVYVLLIFGPLAFWEIPSGPLRLILFVVFLTGACLMGRSLVQIYYWVKGNVFEFRFSYLKNVRNHNDLETVWRSVWQTKNINLQNERQFFEIFSSTINRLLRDHGRKS